MNSKFVTDICNACSTNPNRIAGAYMFRQFAPYIMLLPLIYFGFTVTTFIVTVIVFQLTRRIIEHMFHGEFAAAYSIRHFNLRAKGK